MKTVRLMEKGATTKPMEAMTKNEIVARWLGWECKNETFKWLTGTPEINHPSFTKVGLMYWVSFDTSLDWLNVAWVKFRDLKFERHKPEWMWHYTLCGTIRDAITNKSITEAFDELVKGIEWYNSLKKEV